MQKNNANSYNKQKLNQSNNPLKQLFSHNLSPRQKLSQNTKQKNEFSTIELGNKYCYSVNDLIGDGYTSKVYKGYEIQNKNNTYAIKVIQKKKLNEDQIKLIKNQLQVHPKLDHQNIVKCYDVFDTPKLLHIVMQFCPHGDLAQFIQQNKTKTVPQFKAIQLMKQIIQGYKYLIGQGILHRDLKPPNILRSGKTLKIADFGFAVKGKKTLIDNMSVGTPLYMPPQSIQQCVYSHKSDFFALGCIMFEILHGRTPWYKNDQKALANIMKKCEIDLSQVKNYNIRDFILGACQISQSYRMSIDQFMQFDFHKPVPQLQLNLNEQSNPESTKNARNFLKQKTDRRNNSKKSRQQLARSIKSKKSETAMEATFASTHVYFKNAKCQETKRITAEFEQKFQICLLLKYLIENADSSILLQEFDRKNLKIVLFRHCIYILKKLLCDFTRTKTFDLKNWEAYKQTKQFKIFQEQCKNIKQKIQKDFNFQLKGMSLKNLSQVNKKFPQLSYQYNLTKNFYQKLRQFIRQTMRKFHTEIMKKFTKSTIISPLATNNNSQYYEAFKSLYRYYQFNEEKQNLNISELNKSFNTTELKTVNTTKNSSNISSNQNYCHSINKNKSSQKQLQLGSSKKVSTHQENNHYFGYSSPQHEKISVKSPTSKQIMNMTSGGKFSSNQGGLSQQYYQTQQGKNHLHYYNYTVKVSQDQKTLNKVKSKENLTKNVQFQAVTVQNQFASILCKNFQQSKMTKQEFIGMKKKIKWLW